jgi:hypothetical protein
MYAECRNGWSVGRADIDIVQQHMISWKLTFLLGPSRDHVTRTGEWSQTIESLVKSRVRVVSLQVVAKSRQEHHSCKPLNKMLSQLWYRRQPARTRAVQHGRLGNYDVDSVTTRQLVKTQQNEKILFLL